MSTLRPVILMIAVGALALTAEAWAADFTPGLVPEESLKTQITLSIPEGWFVHDQGKLVGQAGPLGTVIYSAVSLIFGPSDAKGQALIEKMEKLDTGEIPHLELDRIPGRDGATCEGITAAAEKKILKIVKGEDPMFSRGYKIQEAPHAEPAELSGVRGIHILGRSRGPDGKEVVLDLFAFADGKTLYLLYARGQAEYFERSRSVLALVLQTVRLTQCGAPLSG